MTDLIDAYIQQRDLVARLSRLGELWVKPPPAQVLGAYMRDRTNEKKGALCLSSTLECGGPALSTVKPQKQL